VVIVGIILEQGLKQTPPRRVYRLCLLNNAMPTKTIAISGGSRGIGRATAEAFARQGWTVAVAARTAPALDAMRADWSVQFPAAALHTFVADLATPDGCQAWADALATDCPAIDALVHNAGAFAPATLLHGDDPLPQFLATNLLSAHYLTRACLPTLRASGAGHIVTIGSVATTDWPPPMSAYALSKYALEGWHRAIATELATEGIRTTLIRPGGTFTSSWDGVPVDPATLLRAEQVAHWVWQAVAAPPNESLEEICVRPNTTHL
jgi:NAD(P)-dependent dehydrogenase (short-subunit alcohol dehydrogenase family)